jgi:hypothetical protein
MKLSDADVLAMFVFAIFGWLFGPVSMVVAFMQTDNVTANYIGVPALFLTMITLWFTLIIIKACIEQRKDMFSGITQKKATRNDDP